MPAPLTDHEIKYAVLTASNAWRVAHAAWQACPNDAHRLAHLRTTERELAAALRAVRETAR